MVYKVEYLQRASSDLVKIRAYISRDDPQAAESFAWKLIEAAESLNTYPERGGFVTERPGARYLVVHPYLVIYRILAESKTVHVLRFWHGARARNRMRL